MKILTDGDSCSESSYCSTESSGESDSEREQAINQKTVKFIWENGFCMNHELFYRKRIGWYRVLTRKMWSKVYQNVGRPSETK